MVFISYSSKDTDAANAVRMVLQKNGIDCWMAPESIAMGDDYSNAIPKAIEVCDLFLLILSENSQGSKWVPKELDRAISYNKPIIPFQIDGNALTTSFNFMLSNIQRIEAFYDLETSYAKLLAHIKIELDLQNQHNSIKHTLSPHSVPTHTDKSSDLHCLSDVLKEMYFSMVAYREAMRKGKIEEINRVSGTMQNSAQKVFIYYEYNQFSDKENALKAKNIVDQYNLFIEYYGKFISFPPGESRGSDVAQQYAKKAEDIFNTLMKTIVEMCSSFGK